MGVGLGSLQGAHTHSVWGSVLTYTRMIAGAAGQNHVPQPAMTNTARWALAMRHPASPKAVCKLESLILDLGLPPALTHEL